MAKPIIETPKGTITVGKGGKAKLVFDTNFQPKWQKRYSEAQKFVDSEVLRLCDKYIPMRTGMLIKSGILGTEIGSGTVEWIAPYAKRQYYQGREAGSSQTGPLRGAFWFQRMKEEHGKTIIARAKRIATGGG